MDKYLKDFAYVLSYYRLPKEWYTFVKDFDFKNDNQLTLYDSYRPFAISWNDCKDWELRVDIYNGKQKNYKRFASLFDVMSFIVNDF